MAAIIVDGEWKRVLDRRLQVLSVCRKLVWLYGRDVWDMWFTPITQDLVKSSACLTTVKGKKSGSEWDYQPSLDVLSLKKPPQLRGTFQ